MSDPVTAAQTADWRRRVFALYSAVRQLAASEPETAHAHWVSARNELFAGHPATPLLPADRAGFTGLPVARYEAEWRFEVEIDPMADDAVEHLDVPTGTDGMVPFERLGRVRIPFAGTLDVWRLASYGGGIFLPVRDATSGRPGGSYGGGRYLLDTAKGADLGGTIDDTVSLVLDFNFAYNPSCAYDPAWACPLAPGGTVVDVDIPVGERYPGPFPA